MALRRHSGRGRAASTQPFQLESVALSLFVSGACLVGKPVSTFPDHALVDAPHLPRQALIDAHGSGGFRFAGLSHRGSLLCMPDGIWAWPVDDPAALSEDTLAR